MKANKIKHTIKILARNWNHMYQLLLHWLLLSPFIFALIYHNLFYAHYEQERV